ncbi:hypothetical protein CTI14_01070 [Methylobacterium radiotolerans]|nr:hypothetical protein CTI14_01070 [Methylobacterium radiotolerans]
MKVLPAQVATALEPWLSVVEAFPSCTDQVLQTTVAAAITNLRRRVIVTDLLEVRIENARGATIALLDDKLWDKGASSSYRDDAVVALNSLIIALLDARPNQRAKGLSLDW